MKKERKSAAFFHSDIDIWILAAIMTLIMLVIVLFGTKIAFMSNDDYFLMASLNGMFTGAPSFFSPYATPIFSNMLSWLYTWNGNVNWYVLYHYIMLFLSICVIGRCVFRTALRKKLSIWSGIFLFMWLLFGVFIYPSNTISFTMTAIISGSAAAALIFSLDPLEDCNAVQRFDLILAFCLCFFGCILRFHSVLAVACFILLGVAYQLLCLKRASYAVFSKEFCRIAGFGLCVLFMLGAVFILQKVESSRYQEFSDFNIARSLYLDYPHLHYKDIPDEYEALGITEETAYILDQWFLADESITADTLEKLLDAGKAPEAVGIALSRGFHLILDNKFVLSELLICLLLFSAAVWFFLKKRSYKQYWPEFLSIVCAALGAFMQCFILCWFGRFLQQVFFAAAVPCIVSIMLLVLKVSDCRLMRSPNSYLKERLCEGTINAAVGFIGLFLVIAAAAVTCYKPVNYVFHPDIRAERTQTIERSRAFSQYISGHQENKYMYDAASKIDIDPFPLNSGEAYYNALSWGDSYYHSPGYNAQVEAMGRNSFYSDALLEDHVYFISDPRQYSIAGMLYYMCQKSNVVALKCVDEVTENLNVYDFMQLKFDDDFTGWKEYFDMRYYIKNGEIQTGWFRQNGEWYYGWPQTLSMSITAKEMGNQTYILCNGGSVATGFITIDDKSYFFDSNGIMQSGWFYIADHWRYFQKNGELLCSEWLKEDGNQYFFNNEGALIYTVPSSRQVRPAIGSSLYGLP